MKAVVKSVDPITFEILSHKLYQIVKETGTTLERVGGTVNTTQMHDYVAALYRADGDIMAAAESMAVYVACAGFALKRIIEQFEKDEGIYPDDIFLFNDPYLGALHQSDVFMIFPIHYKGELIAWSATFVHVMDIGAMSPGGTSPGATEIFHEGIRIPGIKLVERGRLRRDVFDTIINMTRQPEMVGLDLKCEIAANNVAKARMQELIEQYGLKLIDTVSSEMIQYSETILRDRITEIPDGSWRDSVVIEEAEAWKFKVELRKNGSCLFFDFTGSDKQAKKGVNLPYHATLGVCFEAVFATLGYDLPKNHGGFRPIKVIAPEGTVVNVQYPAPVSLNTTSGLFAVRYLVTSVLAQMLATSEKWKKEVMAVFAGHRAVRHAGKNQYGAYYVSGLAELDGSGATGNRDGTDSGGSLLSCNNVEWAELNFPLLYLFRRHIENAGGAGKFRGGSGSETAITIHDAPESRIKGVAYGLAGLRNSGRGFFGGYPAAPSILLLLEDTRIGEFMAENRWPQDIVELGGQAKLLPYCDFDLRDDDVLYLRRGSGGGFGDPLEREPHAVLRDVLSGLVSKEAARDVYGVVVTGEGIDIDMTATAEFRVRLREERLKEP